MDIDFRREHLDQGDVNSYTNLFGGWDETEKAGRSEPLLILIQYVKVFFGE